MRRTCCAEAGGPAYSGTPPALHPGRRRRDEPDFDPGTRRAFEPLLFRPSSGGGLLPETAMTDHDVHAHDHGSGDQAGDADHRTATDPVCGMKVDPKTSRNHAVYGGETYHFCSEACRARFTADPEKYLAPKTVSGVPERHGQPSAPKGVVRRKSTRLNSSH